MAKYHENLLRDNTLSNISITKKMLSLAVLLMLKIPNEAFLWITRYLVERHEQKKNFVCSISLSVSLPVCLYVHYSIHLSVRLTFCPRPTLLGGGGGGSALWVKRV